MAALKGRSVETFLARLEPKAHVVLLHGPDVGLVNERARAVVRRFLGAAAHDPFQAPVLSAESLAADPAKLADELYSIPLFGGSKALRVRSAGDALAPLVAPVLKDAPPATVLVLEAGELKAGSPLRKLVEGAAGGVAIACYRDAEADLERLIDQELSEARPTPEARVLLLGLLGGDRGASRAELAKLALYALGQGRVGEADVLAVLGDAAAVEMDDLVDAAFEAKPDLVARGYRRLIGSGGDPSAIAGAALRRADTLAGLGAKVDGGASLEQALSGLRPPPHFKRRDALARAARRWSARDLNAAARRLNEAVLLSRQLPALGPAAVERALLAIAVITGLD